MTNDTTDLLPQKPVRFSRRPSLNVYVLGALVLTMAMGGGGLVLRFSDIQEKRELMAWQNKLNLVADSRTQDVDQWLAVPFRQLGEVASNPSLQLYLTELLSEKPVDPVVEEDPAQKVFLRNLLVMTAERLGFLDKTPSESDGIKADVHVPSGTGIAIVSADGKVVVSTAGLSALDPTLNAKVAEAPKDKGALIDLFSSQDHELRLGFVLPVYPIQADEATSKPIARLIAVKNVGDDLFRLLRQPGVSEKTLQAVLVREEGPNVVYLSPVAGEPPATKKLDMQTPDLDASFAIRSPDSFDVKKDNSFQTTLMTSRRIAGAPWALMLHVSRDEAMAESDTWRKQTQAIMFFALLAAVGGLVAVWFYGTSKRTLLLSLETARLARQLAAQEKMLRVVADHQLEPIMIVDQNDVMYFANEKAAHAMQLTADEAVGKDLVALLGAARAIEYSEANRTALARAEPVFRTWRKTTESGEQVLYSAHIPLPHIPVERLAYPAPGVLIIDQDVTEVVSERERRLALSQQVINALVDMVDRRDHNAAHHSSGVALVAREIAHNLGLEPVLIDAAETAGKLMNIGKIVVPSELLTKKDALAQDEITFIRASFQRSAEILQHIAFDGPVVETLRQALEHFDGSGPMKLRGEAILVTARIISVANAFVAMISPRAYRSKTPDIDAAIKTLLHDHDAQYDLRVIVALAHFIDNQNGRDALVKIILKMS